MRHTAVCFSATPSDTDGRTPQLGARPPTSERAVKGEAAKRAGTVEINLRPRVDLPELLSDPAYQWGWVVLLLGMRKDKFPCAPVL